MTPTAVSEWFDPDGHIDQTARVDPTGGHTVFDTAILNPAIGTIELSSGDCPWNDVFCDPTDRPVLVRPIPGQVVRFIGPQTGDKTIGDGIFRYGSKGYYAKDLTFDGLTHGGFLIDGVLEACTGWLGINGSGKLTWRNFTVRNQRRSLSIGTIPQPWKTYTAYISGQRNSDLLIEEFDILPPAVHRDVSGLQLSSTTVAQGKVTIRKGTFAGLDYAFIDWQVPCEQLFLEDLTITDCGHVNGGPSVRLEKPLSGSIVGHIKNVKATGSGGFMSNAGAGFVDAGGNSWA